MSRFAEAVVAVAAVALIAAGCGSDPPPPAESAQTGADGTCLAGDPNCHDTGADIVTPPLSESIQLADPEGPIAISFGGFFYSDGATSRLCDSLEASVPPQCGTSVVEIVGPFERVLEHVAESFGNPDDARVNTEQGIWWTDDWVNISGILEAGKLVIS